LRDFIVSLNKTSNEAFELEIQKIFDVDIFLRNLIVEICTLNLDGYSVNHNNYHMYQDIFTKKWHFIPYDMDATFITFINPLALNISIYQFERLTLHPLMPYKVNLINFLN
jgi:spore coat protein CotH